MSFRISLLAASSRHAIAPPEVNYDDFTANTLPFYTQTQDTPPAGWSISGGKLIGAPVAGAQASLVRTSTSIADGYVEAIIDTAQDSGLLFRFIDQQNFYLMTISDSSGSNPTTNFRLFKRVEGSFTLLSTSGEVSWTRGDAKTVRLEGVGSSVVGKFEGSTVVSATDSALAGPGRVGVRSNAPPGGGTNTYDYLEWSTP